MAMYCRKCHYPLDDLPEQRCPECGTPFDADDWGTFLPDLRSRFDEMVPKLIVGFVFISATIAAVGVTVVLLVSWASGN